MSDCHFFFVLEDLIPLPTIWERVPWGMPSYHPSEALSWKWPSEAPEVGDSKAYAASVEGENDWDFSELDVGSDLGHRASICGEYDQRRGI